MKAFLRDERDVRPVGRYRVITGGTCSPRGSVVFGHWMSVVLTRSAAVNRHDGRAPMSPNHVEAAYDARAPTSRSQWVHGGGLEPPRLSTVEPKPTASAIPPPVLDAGWSMFSTRRRLSGLERRSFRAKAPVLVEELVCRERAVPTGIGTAARATLLLDGERLFVGPCPRISEEGSHASDSFCPRCARGVRSSSTRLRW